VVDQGVDVLRKILVFQQVQSSLTERRVCLYISHISQSERQRAEHTRRLQPQLNNQSHNMLLLLPHVHAAVREFNQN